MRARRLKVSLVAVVGVAAGVFLVPTLWFRPWVPEHLYIRIFAEFLYRHPLLMTEVGLPGIDPRGGELDDFSPQAQEREAAWVDRQLHYLRAFDFGRMSPAQRTSAAVLDWFLADQQEGRRFLFMDDPVNQFAGVQSELPAFMIGSHPLRRPADAERYISRLRRFGVAFDQVIAGLERRERLGIDPPRFVIERVLAQTRAFIAVPPDSNPLATHLRERLAAMPGLGDERRRALAARGGDAVRTGVYPAYQRLIDHLAAAEPRARSADGVWVLPNGDAYYAHLLRSHTTTDLSPERIHAQGLAEVARIQGEMRRILAAQRLDARDPGAAMERLGRDPRFVFPPGERGRAALLTRYRALLADAGRRLDSLFDQQPRARLEVQPVPAFKEVTSSAAYYEPGSLDGSRPGVFFANLHDPAATPSWSMPTLAYHEGIPGHHFQISTAQELRGVPMFRRFIPFTAYTEGWGLYAEQLALEHGFESDPYDRLGALSAELFRAARLVVDTGIHRMRWTREQAIDYMVKTTGEPESKMIPEVERYIVMPGQACAYKVGELELIDLRQRAMERLGPRFDLRAFHHVVLGNGAVPLTILERLVEDWIVSRERSGGAARPVPARGDG